LKVGLQLSDKNIKFLALLGMTDYYKVYFGGGGFFWGGGAPPPPPKKTPAEIHRMLTVILNEVKNLFSKLYHIVTPTTINLDNS